MLGNIDHATQIPVSLSSFYIEHNFAGRWHYAFCDTLFLGYKRKKIKHKLGYNNRRVFIAVSKYIANWMVLERVVRF